MTISLWIKIYIAAFVAFIGIDMIWLGIVARGFYSRQLGHLLAPSPNWAAALVFYLLWIAGLLILAVVPGLQAGSMSKAVLLGALFGFMTYATYDLTNLATVKGWPLIVSLIDLAWGTFLAASVSTISFLVGRWLLR